MYAMFLKHQQVSYHWPHKQRGLSLAFLLFAIIIISLLAGALVKLNSQSVIANAQQVISTRAFFAAETGTQLQALRVFPVNGGAAVCSDTDFSFTVAGLNGCTATTTCTTINVNSEDYYQVTSSGQCNKDQLLQATRTIEVRLKDVN